MINWKMRSVESTVAELPPSSSAAAVVGAGGDGGGGWLYGWFVECHGLWHNVFLIVPSALFVLYLASQAKKSFSKVYNGRSHVVAALYAILWLVSIFNLAWCSLQRISPFKHNMYHFDVVWMLPGVHFVLVGAYLPKDLPAWECAPGKQFMWSVVSLFTTSGMLFLEVSLIAFLLQGNHASGREALTQTFMISAIVVGLDIFLKGIYLFGFGIPLFDISTHGSQWALWFIHKLLLTGVYGLIFFMYRSRWRERLPARPAFQNYISIMFCINATASFACALAAHGTGFGLWLYNITVICYHAMYLPLLYVTFLADFLQEDDLRLENVYYSEMKDAGFFDVDWE